MSLNNTKNQLLNLLADTENKVIALSGKWGTGKSHMWREVKQASQDNAVQNALYVSLFGLGAMEQIKLKIVQSALTEKTKHSDLLAQASKRIQGIKNFLGSFDKRFSAIDELALLALPNLLKDKLIVLDDIERKHEKLNIDEILGFIDEFTQQHGVRFVIILNSDQLNQRSIWDTLREKVVDQELRLSTSAEEAFEIAIKLTPSNFAEKIEPAIELCGVTNIRIIRKVIKATNLILGDRPQITDEILARTIPSIVLLAAINYKGIEDGPDFDFVLSQGTARDWVIVADTDAANSEEGKRKSRWKLLMRELGIHGCDEFELVVVEFLESGLFDVTKVAEIMDRYVAEDDKMKARSDFNDFQERYFWDHRLSVVELLTMAQTIVEEADLIDPYMVTSFHDAVAELPGGQVCADAAIDKWIETFNARNLENFDSGNFFNRKLHPKIQAEFDNKKAETQANMTIFEALQTFVQESAWGPREEIALRGATVYDMEAFIRNSPIKELSFFMPNMIKLYINKATYEPHFGTAMDNFVVACRNISNDPRSDRLGKLLRLLFDDARIGSLLAPAN